MPAEGPLKQVYAAQNPTEAHLVAGLLEQEGIPSAVRGDALFTTVDGGGAVLGMRPTVWIGNPEQETAAKALIARYDRGEILAHPEDAPWICTDCGEHHDPPFTSCWRCGAERPH